MTDTQIEHEVHVVLETIRKLALLRRLMELQKVLVATENAIDSVHYMNSTLGTDGGPTQ